MALSSNSIIKVWTTGSDNNSGLFNPLNANMATNLVIVSGGNTSSPVVSSATYVFQTSDIGAWLYIKSGTGWYTGWFQIVAVSGGQATLNAAIGSSCWYPAMCPNTVVGISASATLTGGTWSIDYSQQASAQIAYTDLVIGATTTQFTSSANSVGVNLVGNHVRITGGTGFTTGVYEILSVSGTTATCDRSLGTASSTAGTGNLGGVLASPGAAGTYALSPTILFIKSGTYLITSGTANVSGGCLTVPAPQTDNLMAQVVGYTNIMGDGAPTRPVLQFSGITSATMISGSGGSAFLVENLILDGNNVGTSGASTGGTGLSHSGGNYNPPHVTNCKFQNFNWYALNISQGYLLNCEFYNNYYNSYVGQFEASFCWYHNSKSSGYGIYSYSTSAIVVNRCIFDAMYQALVTTGNNGYPAITVENSLFCNMTSHAIVIGNQYNSVNIGYKIDSCLFVNNGGNDINLSGKTLYGYVTNCASYNATSGSLVGGTRSNNPGTYANFYRAVNHQILTSNPIPNLAAQDYRLSPNSGLKNASWGLIGGLSLVATDVGPIQHADQVSYRGRR